MLMMWKIQQAMQDDAFQTARIHPTFNRSNRNEVFIWQKSLPAYQDLRNQAPSSLSYKHIKNFTKGLEVRY